MVDKWASGQVGKKTAIEWNKFSFPDKFKVNLRICVLPFAAFPD
jgi:hypothetical protein